MAVALLERQEQLVAGTVDRRAAVSMPALRGGPSTLEDAVSVAWADLTAHAAAACLVCGGRMSPRYGAAGHWPVGGRCADCGAVLG